MLQAPSRSALISAILPLFSCVSRSLDLSRVDETSEIIGGNAEYFFYPRSQVVEQGRQTILVVPHTLDAGVGAACFTSPGLWPGRRKELVAKLLPRLAVSHPPEPSLHIERTLPQRRMSDLAALGPLEFELNETDFVVLRESVSLASGLGHAKEG